MESSAMSNATVSDNDIAHPDKITEHSRPLQAKNAGRF